MHASFDGDGMNRDPMLGSALRGLPLARPPRDLWPALERSLAGQRKPRRWFVPAALAASMLLGLVWTRSALHETPANPAPAETTVAAGSTSAAELERVRARSRELEHWLAARPAQTALDAPTLMAAAEVEDLVGFIDVQLSATRDDSESLPLWRQRVALLEDLALIRSTDQFQTAALAGDPAFMPTSL